jgi:hypothetical protein
MIPSRLEQRLFWDDKGKKMDSEAKNPCRTMSIPEGGSLYYGLSRNGSYDAAKRGEIPVLRVGRKLRVPVAAMERLLENVTLKSSVTP